MTEFMVLKLENCPLGRARDFTLCLDSMSSPQRMNGSHTVLRSAFYLQLMVWKGREKAVREYGLSSMK